MPMQGKQFERHFWTMIVQDLPVAEPEVPVARFSKMPDLSFTSIPF